MLNAKDAHKTFTEQVSAACQLGQRSDNLQLPYYAHETRVDTLQCLATPLCHLTPITCLEIAIFAVFRVVTTNNAAFWDVMQRYLLLLSVWSFLRNGFLRKFDNSYQNIQRHIPDEGNLPACMTCFKYVGRQESKGRLLIALA